MRIDVSWGTGTVPVEIDSSRVGGVLKAKTEPATDPGGTLLGALAKSNPSFQEFLANAPSPMLVVANDATRPTPTAAVMKIIGGDLDRWLADGNAGVATTAVFWSGSSSQATSSSPDQTTAGSSPAPTSTSASSARTTGPKSIANSMANRPEQSTRT